MIKIVAVDDDKAFLASIKTRFQQEKGYRLVKTFSEFRDRYNVENMLQKIQEIDPDIILMDYSFLPIGKPADYGLELTRAILEQNPERKIIMLVLDDHDSTALVWEKIRRSFDAGACAYLGKQALVNWKEAINEVANGNNYVNQKAIKAMLKGLQKDISPRYQLTVRQKEVLLHLADDKSTKEIAPLIMGSDGKPITTHAVNFHFRNIKAQLKCKTLYGAVAKAVRNNII